MENDKEKICTLCGHSLKDNLHGFDQNDAVMDGEELVHSGRCTYCKICNMEE
jgi:hypothetical protein